MHEHAAMEAEMCPGYIRKQEQECQFLLLRIFSLAVLRVLHV